MFFAHALAYLTLTITPAAPIAIPSHAALLEVAPPPAFVAPESAFDGLTHEEEEAAMVFFTDCSVEAPAVERVVLGGRFVYEKSRGAGDELVYGAGGAI